MAFNSNDLSTPLAFGLVGGGVVSYFSGEEGTYVSSRKFFLQEEMFDYGDCDTFSSKVEGRISLESFNASLRDIAVGSEVSVVNSHSSVINRLTLDEVQNQFGEGFYGGPDDVVFLTTTCQNDEITLLMAVVPVDGYYY